MGNIYEQRCCLDDNGLDNGGLCGLPTVLRSSRLVFMSNPFVPLTVGLNIDCDHIFRCDDFVRHFVTHLFKLFFQYGFGVGLEQFLPLLDFVKTMMRRRVLCLKYFHFPRII